MILAISPETSMTMLWTALLLARSRCPRMAGMETAAMIPTIHNKNVMIKAVMPMIIPLEPGFSKDETFSLANRFALLFFTMAIIERTIETGKQKTAVMRAHRPQWKDAFAPGALGRDWN